MQTTQPGNIFADTLNKIMNANNNNLINEVATVSSVSPLRIRLISGLELDNRFLYIAADLVKHERNAKFTIKQDKVTAKTTINGGVNSSATTNISGSITANTSIGSSSAGESHSHTANTTINNGLSAGTNVTSTHNITATTTITQTGGINQDTNVTLDTILHVGDIVIVCKINEGQKYVILNRIVKA